MRINSSRKDIIWNYAGTFFSLGTGYLVLPMLLWALDDTTLGCWYVFQNLSNMSNLLLFGFSPAFARNIAYCWSGAKHLSKSGMVENISYSNHAGRNENEVDPHLFSTVIRTCRTIYLAIAMIALFLFGILGTIYLIMIVGLKDIEGAGIAWTIFLAAICTNIYFGWYTMALEGIGRFHESNKAKVLGALTRIILTAIFLCTGYGIAGACMAYLCSAIIIRLASKKLFSTNISHIETVVVKTDDIRACLSVIWPNTWRDGIVSLADFLCLQASSFVFSFFLPLSVIGIYSMILTIITAIGSVARSFQLTQAPVLQSAFITKDTIKMKETQCACILVGTLMFWVGIISFILIGIPVLKLLKPSLTIEIIYVLGLGTAQFILLVRNIYAGYISTTNRLDYWVAFIISGTMTVLITTMLLKFTNLGLLSIIISSICSEIVYNAWHWPRMVNRELNIRLPDIYIFGKKYITRIFYLKGVK